jgi:formylglycine-generating enzyme required for sulfatase activity
VEFRFLFAGRYEMGFSEGEERASRILADSPPLTISEMRPGHLVAISPFFVSAAPLSVRIAKRFLGDTLESQIETQPAFLTKRQADRLCEKLDGSLPTEEQWEYLCRAGSQTLFMWGDTLSAYEQLERLLDWEIENNESVCAAPWISSVRKFAP